MRISPIQARLEVAGIQKTAPVARSSQAILPEEEEDDDYGSQPRRQRRRSPQLAAPTGAGAHASSAVLSALIDLQAQGRR